MFGTGSTEHARITSAGNMTVTGTVTGTSFNSITGLASVAPLIDGIAAVGSSTLAARQDHVHPTDTTRAATNQTMYIGTTALAINRASAAQALTGITSIDGSATRIAVADTRAVDDQPQGKTGTSVSVDFKNNSAVSSPPVASSGSYSHVMTVAGWDVGGSGGWPAQVSFGDGLAIRQATSATVWGPWRTILNSNNYNTYSPTLTGTGASGSWGISVTGSAATLTTARTINGVSFNGSANIMVPSLYDAACKRITNPGGAEYTAGTSTITGAIAITLPVGMVN